MLKIKTPENVTVIKADPENLITTNNKVVATTELLIVIDCNLQDNAEEMQKNLTELLQFSAGSGNGDEAVEAIWTSQESLACLLKIVNEYTVFKNTVKKLALGLQKKEADQIYIID